MQPQILDPNLVVTDMEKFLRRLIGEDIDLATILTKPVGRIEVDRGQLEQIIANLVVNARDAMPQGGKLTIETDNAILDEHYASDHIGVIPGRYVMLAVSDTGLGMSADIKERIFDPFFTTKEQGKGTGLGLSMVHGIVNQSGGHIWVYSEPGQGTTFKIYLPYVERPLETETITPRNLETLSGNETILLVEDETQVRSLIELTLSEAGYQVLTAAQGEEALRLSRTHPQEITLLVTDVILPGPLNGRQLAEVLVQERPALQVLYISGYTANAIVHQGVLDEGLAFLPKPFSPETLLRRVREVLTGKTV